MAPDLDCITPAQPMEGYLRKSKKWSKRYFVLREGPPPCLEYYDSAKRKNGKPKRIIELKNAWNIDKKVSSKQKYLIGIYTEGEYFAMAAETDSAQEVWVHALKKAVFGCKGRANTMHLMYKHIWQGNVDTKDLENCDSSTRINLQGSHRCCLTDKTMVFVRVNGSGACNLTANNHVEITIASIRSCGHKDNMFFMEPGRSSGIGTGKLWMELDDAAIADNMHKKILELWNLGQEDRQRSYSFGSTTGRPSNNRSRHYYNPPPRQVGMGKPTNTPTLPKPTYIVGVGRNRCESFPATQAATLTDDSRYRTSSEGETTMKRHYALNSLLLRRKAGSVSPNTKARGYSQFKHPLHLQSSLIHCRTVSLPGSYSSSNSSIEHINLGHDFPQNGQSPVTSESQGSSDEFSCSPLTDLSSQAAHIRHALLNISHAEMAPPPPSVAPQTTPILLTASTPSCTVQSSDYASMQPAATSHSRSHSLDDNLSCDTGASSLSASPQTSSYLPGVSPDTSYFQSPSQCSSHSHMDMAQFYTPSSASPDDYALMSPGSTEAYPHETSLSKDQLPSDYTPMTPGRGAATSTPTEDKSGYVPMRPLVRSQPQDIIPSRRRSLSENRLVNGSYSPASPLSRSPDKAYHGNKSFPTSTCAKCKREMPHSYPCKCSSMTLTTAKGPAIPPVSCHGLKVDAKNDFSFDTSRPNNHLLNTSRHNEQPPMNYSDDYASMDGLARNMPVPQLRSSPNSTADETKDFPTNGPELDHEYLPMSPMNAANSKKSIVSNVLSIAESASKPTPTASGLPAAPKYPHQRNVTKPTDYCTNSLDRSSSKQPRRRTKSLFAATLGAGHRHVTRTSKHPRKHSLRINTDAKSSTSSSIETSSNPPLSPGGEYVSISFDKAKKQVGPDYVSLTEGAPGSPVFATHSSADTTTCNQRPSTPKVTHDSNRNILPAKQSPPKDEYTLLKPGDVREAQL